MPYLCLQFIFDTNFLSRRVETAICKKASELMVPYRPGVLIPPYQRTEKLSELAKLMKR